MRSYNSNRSESARRSIGMTAIVGATLAVLGHTAKLAMADIYTWTVPNDDNWSTGFSPVTPPSDFGTQLVFTAGNYTANNDLGNFNLNSIEIDNTPDTNLITVSGYSTLTFGGTAPALTVNGGSASIVGQLATSDGTQITNNGAGTLTLSAGEVFASNGATTITNTGAGTITLTDAAPYYGTNSTINLANTGTGIFQIGNLGVVSGDLGSGVTGTVNITAGAVTFAGNTGGDLFTGGMILNVSAGASFNFANNGETFGGLTGAGNIILGSAGMTFTEPGDRTFTGTISGTGGVSQNTASIFYLGGSNSYSGNTTIEASGTIRATAANVFSPSSVVNIVAGAGTLDPGGFDQTIGGLSGGVGDVVPVVSGTLTLAPAAGTTDTFFGSVAGAGNLTVNGAGTQTILGTNAITGATTVNSGTLRVPYAGLTASSTITIGTAGTLDMAVATSVTSTLPLSGTGTLTKSGLGTLTFNTANSSLNLTSLNVNAGGVALNYATDSGSQIGANPALNLGSASVSVVGNSSTATSQAFNGLNLTGGGEIDVTAGTGQAASVNLGNISRLTGAGGTINFNPTSTGASIVTTTPNTSGINTLGGFATYNGSGWAIANTNGSIGTLAAYNTNSWAATSHTDITTNLSLGTGAGTEDVRFNTNATTTVTLSGTNTIGDGGILVTAGTGTKTSTITGSSNASTSALNVPANTDLIVNQFNPTGALTISAIILDTPGTANPMSGVTISGKTITGLTSTAALYIGESVGGDIPSSDNAHIVSINSPTSVTLSASTTPTSETSGSVTFQPGTNLVKSGPGTLTLSKTNTFTGVVDLDGGTLSVSSVGNLGSNSSSGSSSVYFNGGTLAATGSLGGASAAQPFIIGPAGGTINVAPTFTVTKEGNSFFGSGPLTITSSGTGIFSVGTNGSTFTGPVTVNGGIFRFTSNQFQSANGVTINNGGQYQIEDDGVATFNFAAGTPLTLNGVGPAGYANSGAFALTIQSNDGNPVSTFPNPVVLASNSTVGVYNTAAHVANLVLTGTVSGPGVLTVAGDPTNGGTVTMSFANTYTGGTVVANGATLLVANTTGSGTGTGAVNVALGGTLGGNGIISGAVAVDAGGTLFAGLANDVAGKTAAVLTLGSGSTLAGSTMLDLTAGPVAPATTGAADEIVFGSSATPGVANFGGGLTVTNPNSIVFAVGQSYDLFDFGSNPGASDFQSISLPGLPQGLSWNISALPTNGVISVVVASVQLTFNNAGGSGDGTTWDINNQNFNNGSGPSTYQDGDSVTFNDNNNGTAAPSSPIGTNPNAYNVRLNTTVRPQSVTVATAGNYTISGTGGIADETTGPATTLNVTGTGSLTLGGSNTYTGGTTVGTGTDTTRLIFSGASAFPADTALTVNAGATAQIAPHSGTSANTVVMHIGTLTNSGLVDLTNNDLILHSGLSLAMVSEQIKAGFASGTWAGTTGITSSTASQDAAHLTAVGVLINNDGQGNTIYGAPTGSGTNLGFFDGTSPALNDILVKYTYYGDANLDGVVDGSDYTQIDAGFTSAGTLTGWQNGDFNYDGVIDGSDYTLIDNAFNTQGATLGSNPAALVASSTSQITSGSGTVPEPATLSIFAMAAAGMLSRRRRRI
jgi:fibronectin-binding autotransporter adhesin